LVTMGRGSRGAIKKERRPTIRLKKREKGKKGRIGDLFLELPEVK